MSLELANLTPEQSELLRASVGNGGASALYRRSDTRLGGAYGHQEILQPSRRGIRPARYRALRALVEMTLLRPKSAEIFELTNHGWEFAAKVGRG